MKRGTIEGRKRQAEAARKTHTKHGMKGSREYHSWASMKARCNNPKDPYYKDYGERGIRVCQRWLVSFENFYEDMGQRPKNMTLGRKNNSKGYYKENCEWQTHKQQQRNRSSNRLVTFKGKTQPISAWCEELNLNESKIGSRIHQGYSPKFAIRWGNGPKPLGGK